MKLQDIADVRIGLSLDRKKGDVRTNESYSLYKMVTLKSFNNSIDLDKDYLDHFVADEELNPNYLTQPGDLLIRLRSPNFVAYIDDDNAGLLVSSLISIIRLNTVLYNPEFIALYLTSRPVQNQLCRCLKGSTVQMIMNSNISELNIPKLALRDQENIISYIRASRRKLGIMNTLIHEETKLQDEIFTTMINLKQGT